jgi:hypothetical protein
MIWGSDCHVTISYRDVKIIILNFILFKYICILIYKQYQNNEKNVMMKFSRGPGTGWKFKKAKDLFPFVYALKVLTHGQERLVRKVTSVSIHSFVEWLNTFSYVLRPTDVTVKEVNYYRSGLNIHEYNAYPYLNNNKAWPAWIIS